MKIDPEFKNLLRAQDPEEAQQFKDLILSEGIRDPLVLWNGILIDGHHRYNLANEHGLEYDTVEKEFDSRQEVILWICKNQLGKRNISNYDRSCLALVMKDIIAEKAKEKQKEAGGAVVQKSAQAPIKTREELAKLAGVSHDTIAKVEKIENDASEELREKVKSGQLSINQGYQQVKSNEKKEAVIKKAEEYKPSDDMTDIFNTDKKYQIIYADPAWEYFAGGHKNQSLHYKNMTIDEIKALPIQKITDENAILFIWVTFPILPDCLDVISSWGFSYSTCGFTWVKKNKSGEGWFFGCGNWTRANSEVCLIATKGSMVRLDASISQVIDDPIMEHSKKPSCVRDKIVQLVGGLSRIELFSRQKIDGWDYWGNEV